MSHVCSYYGPGYVRHLIKNMSYSEPSGPRGRRKTAEYLSKWLDSWGVGVTVGAEQCPFLVITMIILSPAAGRADRDRDREDVPFPSPEIAFSDESQISFAVASILSMP
jgi:hypothetical protein